MANKKCQELTKYSFTTKLAFFVGFNNSLVRLYLLLEILCPYFYHSVHDIIPHFIICGGPKMSYAKNSLFNPVD